MAESRDLERAARLLRLVAKVKRPLDQRMLVAAALSAVMASPPIVVGGTAEEYWTGDAYRPTDLDLIPDPARADVAAFKQLGFTQEGRHWVLDGMPIATEFPHDDTFEVRRTVEVSIRGAVTKVIGVDDLYMDRLGQSTATMNVRDRHFASVLAVALANWNKLDWRYIDGRIAEVVGSNRALGEAMKVMHRRCRRVARTDLARRRAAEL